MQTREPGGTRTAAPKEEAEPKYEGKPGKTRLKPIHVRLPSGFVRTLSVYDVVNVATDPKLREAAVGGALHRFETGEELAVPFVFHDPAAEKFVLVVPSALRHEELKLRAALLLELAEQTSAPIPSYVRDADTVIGHEGLEAYLTRSKGNGSGDPTRSTDLDIRSDALDQRESRLASRAEEVTRKEDELRSLTEELEAGRADLAVRERELEERFERLVQRERARPSSAAASPSAIADEVVQLVDDEVEALDDEVDDLDPLETTPGQATKDLSQEVELVEAGDPIASDVEDVEDAYVATVVADDDDDDDDVEELDDLEPIDTGVSFRRTEDEDAVSFVSEPPPEPEDESEEMGSAPSASPPPGFLESRHGPDAHAVAEAADVRMFVKLPDDGHSLFDDPGRAELLIQLVMVEECPVVLLVAVDNTDGRPTAFRAALDPRSSHDRAVLDNLRHRFAARVALFKRDGEYLDAIELTAPREPNVARILDRVSRMRTAAAVDIVTAFERVLSSPPPLRSRSHPYSLAPAVPTTASEAFGLIELVADWTTHEKMDHALFELSIPRAHVDATVRVAIEAGLRFGIPLTGSLLERATVTRLVTDVSATVTQQIETFRESSGTSGLRHEQVAMIWESLLYLAAEHEVAVDADTHEAAHKAIREVRGGVDELAAVDPSQVSDMSPERLLALLDHPRFRRDAAVELLARQPTEHADAICRAVRKMSRAEVVTVVPRMLVLGDAAGDSFIDALSARKTFVRQAFALALGHLKLRRAVVPLVHLLSSEESEVWREIARVTGSFGTASLRNVKLQLREPKGKEERYILTLAHLANHGCLKHIEKITQDEKPSIATMAHEALAMRTEAKSVDERVLGGIAIEGDDPVLRFSRRFQQELDGNAPDGDLA